MIRFFETGRMHFIRSLLPELPPGTAQSLVKGKPGGVGVILGSISAKYIVRVLFLVSEILLCERKAEECMRARHILLEAGHVPGYAVGRTQGDRG